MVQNVLDSSDSINEGSVCLGTKFNLNQLKGFFNPHKTDKERKEYKDKSGTKLGTSNTASLKHVTVYNKTPDQRY